jgi:hypothetical protein
MSNLGFLPVQKKKKKKKKKKKSNRPEMQKNHLESILDGFFLTV